MPLQFDNFDLLIQVAYKRIYCNNFLAKYNSMNKLQTLRHTSEIHM